MLLWNYAGMADIEEGMKCDDRDTPCKLNAIDSSYLRRKTFVGFTNYSIYKKILKNTFKSIFFLQLHLLNKQKFSVIK